MYKFGYDLTEVDWPTNMDKNDADDEKAMDQEKR